MAKKAKKQAAKTSGKKPAPKKPIAKKPAVKYSVSMKPAAKTAAGKKPTAKKSTAKKSTAKGPTAKKSASKKPPSIAGPLPAGTSLITTGSGPGPAELGATFVRLFNAGQATTIEREMYDRDIVSVEGHGVGMAWHGKSAVEAKSKEWMRDNIIHGCRAEGPFVGSSGFAVRMEMDVETRSTGKRGVQREIGVYTVRDGKIVREEFMYGM